jgi:hypothetical protein
MDHQSDFDYALELRDSVYFEREEKGYQEQNCPSEAREICDCITSMERGAQDTIVASLFLKLLMEGARVRRHLPYRRSEMIVLYSTDGCSTFRWMAEEDWIFGLNSQSERSMDSNSNTIRIVRSRSSDCAIKDSDILSVQTADCAVPGHFGFNIFRRSLDAHNKNLSFSIISSHESCLGGFARLVMTLLGSQSLSMLHIECDDEATFGLLVAGFELIRRGYSARCELDYNLYINGGIYLSRCQSFPYKKDDTTLKHQITIATNVTEKKAQLKSSPRVQMHEEKENDHTCRVPPRMQISARLRLAGLEVNTIALRKAHKVPPYHPLHQQASTP